ncbi:MAG: DUF2332 family protein [Nitriliruptorales bacterium]
MGNDKLDGARAAQALREQTRYVRGRSALYERLLAGLAGAAERGFDGGVVARLLSQPSVPPPEEARLLSQPSVPPPEEARLLLLAALHHAALEDPDLPHAAWFPTAVGEAQPPDEGAPGALALAHLIEHEDRVADFVSRNRLQTNEVARCLCLLPGLLLAGAYGLPLALVELGCSAGLNLRFDRYRYRYLGGPNWGPAGGPRLEAAAEGKVPSVLTPPSLDISERRGVDLRPIDPTTPEGARLLTAFVWPDEHDRVRRLREALSVAAATPVTLEKEDLGAWAAANLRPVEGRVTVVFHSLVTYLLNDATRRRLAEAVDRALRTATADAPVVHMRFEPPPGIDAPPELTVTVGDGSRPPEPQTVLTGDWHGRWVRWW